MVPITIVNGVYKPSYRWGAPHCSCYSYVTIPQWPRPVVKASAKAAADDRAEQKKQHEQSVKVRRMIFMGKG